MSESPLLTGPEAAALAGIAPVTWRAYVKRGYAPGADIRDASTSWQPRWHRSTVKTWLDQGRDGQGKRNDLGRARAAERRRRDQELAAPASPAKPGMMDWITAHHRELLTVAELLTDHRDTLLDLATAPDSLAEAIDAAGAAMRKQPTKALASAVWHALSMFRRTVRGADPELTAILDHRWYLHEQFGPWAGDDTEP
jgi:hypothetical protein